MPRIVFKRNYLTAATKLSVSSTFHLVKISATRMKTSKRKRGHSCRGLIWPIDLKKITERSEDEASLSPQSLADLPPVPPPVPPPFPPPVPPPNIDLNNFPQCNILLRRCDEEFQIVGPAPARLVVAAESSLPNQRDENDGGRSAPDRSRPRAKKQKGFASTMKCVECDKVFAQQASLRRHLRIHTGVKPYKCGTCEAAFYRTDMLKQHCRAHFHNANQN